MIDFQTALEKVRDDIPNLEGKELLKALLLEKELVEEINRHAESVVDEPKTPDFVRS